MAVAHRRTLATALVAIGLSLALILGPPAVTTVRSAVTLVNTVIGLGGRGDAAGIRVQEKLSSRVVPDGYVYLGCWYPADLNMINSVLVGMPNLREHLRSAPEKVLIAGYSEGTLLAEQIKRDLTDDPGRPDPHHLSFLQIAAPFIPNGGILARFPVLGIPGLIPAMGVAVPSLYGTTYVTMEYDPYADFPAYFNPLALLNTLLAIEYAHPDRVYDPVDSVGIDNFVKEVTNTAQGLDKYILVPNPQLPLLGPLRDLARLLQLTPLTERLLGAVEPLLRVMIDMAYTDREYLSPQIHTPFSLFTPLHKFQQALTAIPGALHEGVQNLLGIPRAPAPPPAGQTVMPMDAQITTQDTGDPPPAPALRRVPAGVETTAILGRQTVAEPDAQYRDTDETDESDVKSDRPDEIEEDDDGSRDLHDTTGPSTSPEPTNSSVNTPDTDADTDTDTDQGDGDQDSQDAGAVAA